MAVTFGGIPVVIQNGGGSWQDIGGGQGSSSSSISFVSGTSSQARKFSGQKGMEWNFGSAQDFSDKLVVMRFQLVGGFAATRLAGGGRIVVNGTAFYNVTGSDTYTAGFQVVVADLTLSPTSGSFTNTSVTTVGLEVNASGGSGGDPNFFIDELLIVERNGITVTGDTTTFTSDLIAFDAAGDYGLVEDANGIALVIGKLDLIPNATGINLTDEVISFSDPVYVDNLNRVSSALGRTGFSRSTTNDLTFTRSTFFAARNPDISNGTSSVKQAYFDEPLPSDSFTNCSFFDFRIGARFGPNNTVSGCQFVRCNTVRPEATISNCTFRDAVGFRAVQLQTDDSLSLLDNCTFEKEVANSHYAVEVALNGGTYNMDWNCTATGWAAGVTGNDVSTNTSGNQAIYFTGSTSTVNISVADGATVPSVRSVSAITVNVLVAQRTLTVTVIDAVTKTAIQGARVYVTAAAGGALSAGTVIIDKDLTDANGQASDQRSYTADQPITGVVRFASTQPYYKTGDITATVSSTGDTNITVALISDE